MTPVPGYHYTFERIGGSVYINQATCLFIYGNGKSIQLDMATSLCYVIEIGDG